MRWWTQSSLMGTETIVGGFRDKDMVKVYDSRLIKWPKSFV
jgi:hypothetical protein